MNLDYTLLDDDNNRLGDTSIKNHIQKINHELKDSQFLVLSLYFIKYAVL